MRDTSVYISILCIILGYSCSLKKETSTLLDSVMKNDTTSNLDTENNTVSLDLNTNSDLTHSPDFELNKIYTDTCRISTIHGLWRL